MTIRDKYAIVRAVDALEETLRSLKTQTSGRVQEGSPMAQWEMILKHARLVLKEWDEQP